MILKQKRVYIYVYIYQTRTKFVEKVVHILPKAVAHPRSSPHQLSSFRAKVTSYFILQVPQSHDADAEVLCKYVQVPSFQPQAAQQKTELGWSLGNTFQKGSVPTYPREIDFWGVLYALSPPKTLKCHPIHLCFFPHTHPNSDSKPLNHRKILYIV